MKEVVKVWQDKRYQVILDDVRGNHYEGIIYESDDTGVVLQPDKKSYDNLILIPWTAICFIKRK